MFEPSRVVALLLARFGPGDGNCATRDERKLAEAFGRILLEAAHCELTIADEEELEVDDEEKMDEEWDIMSEIDEVCSPLPYESGFVGFGGKPIPVEQALRILEMGRIQGVVLISGANRGVGYELTRALLANDAVTRVYGGCRNSEKAENLRTLQDPQKKLRVVDLDVSKDWSIKNVVEAVANESGQLNVLVNNAAILEKDHKAGIPDGDRGVWLRHFDINVVSYAMMIQECLPLLRKSTSQEQPATVINISGRKGSIELCPGTERVHGNYAYMCSKTAVNHLTRILSIEHSDILTVSMCPGWNRTDMGGPSGMKDPSETAPVLLSTVDAMTISEHSGKFWDRKGRPIPY